MVSEIISCFFLKTLMLNKRFFEENSNEIVFEKFRVGIALN
jgi:hypothetical protein